jgi:hypothetical protein
MVNAVTEAAMSPESPAAAASAYAKVPVSTPSIDVIPAARPCSMLRVTT